MMPAYQMPTLDRYAPIPPVQRLFVPTCDRPFPFVETGTPKLRPRDVIADSTAPSATTLATLSREVRFLEYILDRLVNGDISGEAAGRALHVWGTLREATSGTLQAPDVSTGPDGRFLLMWESDSRYLECELFPDGTMEFFERDLRTGKLWGFDTEVDAPLPGAAIKKLKSFA